MLNSHAADRQLGWVFVQAFLDAIKNILLDPPTARQSLLAAMRGGRSRLVQITQKGAALAEQIVEELIATNKTLIGGILDTGEAEELTRLLHKLSTGLQSRKREDVKSNS